MKSIIVFTLSLVSVVFAISGGWFSVPIDDAMVINLASSAIKHHNSVSNSLFHKKLVKIVSAKAQVVAGTNYEVTLIIGITQCAKSDSNAESCEVDVNGALEECTYASYVKLGSDVHEITSGSCKTKELEEEPLVGGWFTVSIDDPKVVELTAKAVEHNNKMNESPYYYKLISIKTAKAQVVAGMNYEITFITKSTSCLKYGVEGPRLCESDANSVSQECTYVFWEKPYETVVPEIVSANCQ